MSAGQKDLQAHSSAKGTADAAGRLAPSSLRDARVLVVGLGRFGGGIGVTRWLVGEGARVTVTDLAEEAALTESLAAIAALDVELHLGGHSAADLESADLVVVNPAVVKAKSAFFRQIQERGVPWTTEMNLFCERCPATVIGVTGTFGKSTTSAMLAAALSACVETGQTPYTTVHLGGNIGRSMLGDLAKLRATDLVVLEMSNAQLEDLPRIPWTPALAVLTNFSPHHLDRYEGSWEQYAQAKLNIARTPGTHRKLVVGPIGAELEALLRAVVPDAAGRLVRVTPAEPAFALKVPGAHNRANADCVATVCRCLDMPEASVRCGLEGFTGLAHRLQFVRTLRGVDWVNDSKSTSPSATIIAAECYDQGLLAIVGAQDKHMPLAECASVLARKCRAVFCTGESGPSFAGAVRSVGGTAGPSVAECPTLEAAVQLAARQARSGEVVLFSPGGPSFDRYANYERRGEHFMRLVHELG